MLQKDLSCPAMVTQVASFISATTVRGSCYTRVRVYSYLLVIYEYITCCPKQALYSLVDAAPSPTGREKKVFLQSNCTVKIHGP